MSIADKLIYLNGTKEKLKDSINNIGGSITNETTFRAYAEELDNIYSNIPKTTGEGSNLSLTTLKGRINVDDILGDTTQEGTPTPSSPQPINVVTGKQEVLVRGKQLFDGKLELGIINGNTGADMANSNYIRTKDYILVEELTNYVMTTDSTLFNSLWVYEYKADKTYNLTANKRYTIGETYTTEEGTAYIRFRPNYQTTDTTIKFMVEKGTTASAWQPYQEQTKIVNLSSKNKLVPINYNGGSVGGITWTMQNGLITASGTCTSVTQSVTTANVPSGNWTTLPSGTYTLSGGTSQIRLQLMNSNGTNIAYDTGTGTTFTTTEDKQVYYRAEISSGVALADTITLYPMLNEGSSALPYEPYYNYELSKIGTYHDRIYKNNDKWYIEKNIGKHKFTGASGESWGVSQTGTANWFYNITNFNTDLIQPFNSGNDNAFSNYYEPKSITSSTTYQGFYIGGNSSSHLGFLRIRYGTEDTTTNYKTWLQTHNLIIYYALWTPTYEEITNTNLLNELNELEKIMSYNGTTNINISGNLPMLVSVSALKGE